MGNTFLSPDELKQLTGLKQSSAQIRYLTARGIPHSRDIAGRPVVLTSSIEHYHRVGRVDRRVG